MKKRTFENLLKRGDLPFIEELEPRAGRVRRFRADLLDRYVTGQWGAPRAFAAGRRAAEGR